MKLVFVSQNEAPFRMRWLDELAKYMDVEVFHLDEYAEGVDKRYISYHTNRAKSIKAVKKIAGKKYFDHMRILRGKYDLLILDGYGFFAQQILALLLITKKKKYGLSVDGGFVPEQEWAFKRLFKRILISNASFLLSTGKETDRFLCYYGAKKSCIYRHFFSNVSDADILPHALSIEEKRRMRERHGVPDTFTFLFCGKFEHGKGLDILSDAVAELSFPCQVLAIGGSGELESSHGKGKTFSHKMKFYPFMEKERLREYYCLSDVFVLPTRHDVWGLVIGEAMAHGLPVITTDMCLAGRAMVKDEVNGYLVPAEDYYSLAGAMERIHQKDTVSMGERALGMVRRYTFEKAARMDAHHFKEIIAKTNG